MMRRDFDSAVTAKDWLTHRWDFRINNIGLIACSAPWHVDAGGCTISTHATRRNAERWVERFKPASLFDVVAAHPELSPMVIVIDGMNGRLARIPEPLWPTYDAIDLTFGGRLRTLSAKARAMFPEEKAVFVRGYPPGDSNLRPRPKKQPVRVA
jgi:hypothetical protein